MHVHGEPELKKVPAKTAASQPAVTAPAESRTEKSATEAKSPEPEGQAVEDLYAGYEGRRMKKDKTDNGPSTSGYVPKH